MTTSFSSKSTKTISSVLLRSTLEPIGREDFYSLHSNSWFILPNRKNESKIEVND